MDGSSYFLSLWHTCREATQVSFSRTEPCNRPREESCCLTSNQLAVSRRIRGISWSAVNGIRADRRFGMTRRRSLTFAPFLLQENISVKEPSADPISRILCEYLDVIWWQTPLPPQQHGLSWPAARHYGSETRSSGRVVFRCFFLERVKTLKLWRILELLNKGNSFLIDTWRLVIADFCWVDSH